MQGCLRLLLPVDIPLVQPNANSVPARNSGITTFALLLSVKFTLSVPIHHSRYWKKYIFFLWIHILNKESKQRAVLYHCNCKEYLWVRQSFAKRCETHPTQSWNCPIYLLVVQNQRPNKPLLQKTISAWVFLQNSAFSAVPGRTGWKGSQGCSAAGFPPQTLPTESITSKAERSCTWLIRNPAYFLLGWSKRSLIFTVLP